MVHCDFLFFYLVPPKKKAADSGDGAKATGESEEKRPARIVDELPDQPEPAIMVKSCLDMFLHYTLETEMLIV